MLTLGAGRAGWCRCVKQSRARGAPVGRCRVGVDELSNEVIPEQRDVVFRSCGSVSDKVISGIWTAPQVIWSCATSISRRRRGTVRKVCGLDQPPSRARAPVPQEAQPVSQAVIRQLGQRVLAQPTGGAWPIARRAVHRVPADSPNGSSSEEAALCSARVCWIAAHQTVACSANDRTSGKSFVTRVRRRPHSVERPAPRTRRLRIAG